ncbi:MAG: helix-turn-helix transcriptional regulator [Candidatus Delongbacteria bacterium]
MNSFLKDFINSTPAYIARKVEHMLNLSVAISEWIEVKGMSKKALASDLGMKQSQLSRILSASSNVTLETLARIETAIGQNIIQIKIPSRDPDYYLLFRKTNLSDIKRVEFDNRGVLDQYVMTTYMYVNNSCNISKVAEATPGYGMEKTEPEILGFRDAA